MQHAIRLFQKAMNQRRFPYFSLFLIHLSIICFAFHKHIFAPIQAIFANWGDGIKNNFTLLSYVKEPISKDGIFKYNSFSYPYGDYVFSTDNTPLFSIPFKWFCHHIYDLSDYTLAIFNGFIISNIIVCGLVLFYIFRRLLRHNLLAWLLALFLPWINFQLARIYCSHYNLSLSAFCVIAIALMILWHDNRGKLKKQLLIAGAMCLFSYCCFLAHGYYVAIIPVFISGMLFFSGLSRFRTREGLHAIITAIAVSGISAVMALGTMKATDRYFDRRQEFAQGYDWMEQKGNFSMLFTHSSVHKLYFPIWIEKNADSVELLAYLSNIGLYAVAILLIISLINRKFRLTLLSIQKDFFSDPLKLGIFCSGLVMLSMSFGEKYYPLTQPLRVTWPLNAAALSIAEVVFLVLLSGISVYAVVKVIQTRKGVTLLELPRQSRNKKIIHITLFYISTAAVLYLAFGRYHLDFEYIVNRTSPIWLLHKFTRKVEQFRSMVRFAWPFYWTFYIWIMYTVAMLCSRSGKYVKVLIVSLIVLLGGEETINYSSYIRENVNKQNTFTKEALAQFNTLRIRPERYQSILPIPYYNAGSEIYNYTLDDIDSWSHYSYQLSLYTKLPLMSCKMSRTPPAFSKDFLDLITYDTASKEMKSLLNSKPVLVAVNRTFISDTTIPTIPVKDIYPVAHEAYWAGNRFAERNGLKAVDSLGDVYFYEWYPR